MPRTTGRGYFLPGGIALAAMIVIGLGIVGLGDLDHSAPSRLAGPAMAAEIAVGIQTQADATSAPAVSCPASEPVRLGLSFDCSVAAWHGSAARTVHVSEIDGRGHLRWAFVEPAATPPAP